MRRDNGIGNAETLRIAKALLELAHGGMTMRNLIRGALGVVGLFNILIGLGFLIDPAQMGMRFFLTSLGTQGLATMRADFTAFFFTGGAFALVAAWRGVRGPLVIPLTLLGIAITGRFISLVADGTPGTAFPPMLAEAVMIAILLISRAVLPGKAR